MFKNIRTEDERVDGAERRAVCAWRQEHHVNEQFHRVVSRNVTTMLGYCATSPQSQKCRQKMTRSFPLSILAPQLSLS